MTIYEVLLSTGSAFGAAGAAWVFSRRRTLADVKHKTAEAVGQEYENFQSYVQANGVMLNDLRERVEQLVKSNRELKEKICDLETRWPCAECPQRLPAAVPTGTSGKPSPKTLPSSRRGGRSKE